MFATKSPLIRAGLFTSVSLIALLITPGAYAQSAEQAARDVANQTDQSASELGEIIVTARKRQETILNVGNVDFTQFGRIGSYPVKGSVYAQPLYVSAVDCAAKGLHSLVIIATMENAVYAYDAEHTGAAARVWAIEGPAGPTLGESVDSKIFDAEGNPYEDFYGKSIGILSTPVIELAGVGPVSGVIYLVSFQFDRTAFAANGNKATSAMFSHVLYALDLGTGQILRKIPVAGRYPGGGYASSPTREKIPLTSPLNIDSTTHTASIAIPFAGKDKMRLNQLNHLRIPEQLKL